MQFLIVSLLNFSCHVQQTTHCAEIFTVQWEPETSRKYPAKGTNVSALFAIQASSHLLTETCCFILQDSAFTIWERGFCSSCSLESHRNTKLCNVCILHKQGTTAVITDMNPELKYRIRPHRNTGLLFNTINSNENAHFSLGSNSLLQSRVTAVQCL